MWKKALPLIVLSGFLLVGCNNNRVVPNNNETPMQDVREDAREWNNNIEGRHFDNNNMNGNRTNTDMNHNRNNMNNDPNMNNSKNPQVEIIEDLNRKNDVEE